MKKCSTCIHWKNKQAELEYSKLCGICTCYKWKFRTNGNGDVSLLDRGNRTDKYLGVNRFENASNEVPFGAVEKSRYCLVTDEKFGCIHHQSEKA